MKGNKSSAAQIQVCIAAVAFGIFLVASATPKVTVKVSSDWSETLPYEPPNERQVHWKLTGSEGSAVPGSSSLVSLKDLVIRQFPVSRETPDFTASSPDCIYNHSTRQVYSPSRLEVEAASGKFQLKGLGYLLDLSGSSIIVSNEVQSYILNQSENQSTNPGPTAIFSQECEFRMQTEATNGVAIYRRQVDLRDERILLACDKLTAQIPNSEKGRPASPEKMIAEENVSIDFFTERGEPLRATCAMAAYSRRSNSAETEQIVSLTGNPRISIANGWMKADSIFLNRTRGKIRGDGNVHLHFEQALSFNWSPGSEKNPAPKLVDISSEHFVFEESTRTATFDSRVVITQPGIHLTSEYLVADLPAKDSPDTNHLNHAVAQTNVWIEFVDARSGQTNRASAQKAVYDFKPDANGASEIIELTGNPGIAVSNAVMSAEVIIADRARGIIRGKGNHRTELTRNPGDPAELRSLIFSDEFSYSSETGLAVYDGRVHAYDPMLNLTGEKLTVQLAKSNSGQTNPVESILAEGGVAADFAAKSFAATDITNLDNFTSRLLLQPSSPSFYDWLRNAMSNSSKSLLMANRKDSSGLLVAELADELNLLTKSPELARMAVEKGLRMSDETRRLQMENPRGAKWIQLNRLILLDAFPNSLNRSQLGDLTHGTGDKAEYHFVILNGVTNETIELTGNPRIEKPGSWIIADERIIVDRTTGLFRFIGHPKFFTKAAGLTTKKLPETLQKGKPVDVPGSPKPENQDLNEH